MKVNLKNVRIGWVNVFEKAKDTADSNGNPIKGKFQLTGYLDKDDTQCQKLEDAVFDVLAEAMKSDSAAEKWMKRNYGFGNHAKECAVRDLAEREKPIEGLEEGLYFKATSNKKPLIKTSAGETQVERGLTIDGDEIEGQEVYGGCYANISIDIYWNATYKLLSFGLLGVRFKADGEAFGGAGETASDDDLDDDDEKPSRQSRRSRDDDDEEEPRQRRSRR